MFRVTQSKSRIFNRKVMMTEAYGSFEQVIGYYGNDTNPGAHFSFNFILITDLNEISTATDFKDKITSWLDALPDGLWSNWVVSWGIPITIQWREWCIDAAFLFIRLVTTTSTEWGADTTRPSWMVSTCWCSFCQERPSPTTGKRSACWTTWTSPTTKEWILRAATILTIFWKDLGTQRELPSSGTRPTLLVGRRPALI